MSWTIYALVDPRDKRIRYVGMTTKEPHKRLILHLCNAKMRDEDTHRGKWIRSLLAVNLRPEITVLETGSGDWIAAERRWISSFRVAGADLTNATDGGEGRPGSKLSPEHVAALRAGVQRRVFTPEQRNAASERLRIANLGKRQTAERRLVTSQVMKGRVITPEHRANLSTALKGRKASPEARANMSASAKVKVFTPEHRANMSAAKLGNQNRRAK